jgi:NAD(P)-dependent dehydrogenase (short-subunit alcohol dehydrogenase family)
VDLVWDYQLQYVTMNFNKIYIIGGASSGIGYDFVKSKSKKNKVIGFYNSTLRKKNNNLNFIKINLEKRIEIKNFFFRNKKILKKYKKIIFINFATHKQDSLLINLEDQNLKKTFNVNLFSNFYFASELIKTFLGKPIEIIFISSSLGLKGDAGTSLYSASKMALDALMKSIVLEYSNFKIKCNIIVLGFFQSPLWNKLPAQKKKNIIELLPGKKIGNISSIVKTIDFIEKNKDINSSSIYVDGGFGIKKV